MCCQVTWGCLNSPLGTIGAGSGALFCCIKGGTFAGGVETTALTTDFWRVVLIDIEILSALSNFALDLPLLFGFHFQTKQGDVCQRNLVLLYTYSIMGPFGSFPGFFHVGLQLCIVGRSVSFYSCGLFV